MPLVLADALFDIDAHTEAHADVVLTTGDARVVAYAHMRTFVEDARVAIRAHVGALGVYAAWLEAAAHAASLAHETGSYEPIFLIDFLDHERTFATRNVTFATPELTVAQLSQGGIGTITQDLDELTDAIRLGGASFALLNGPEDGDDTLLADTFDDNIPLDNTRVRIRLGFKDLEEAAYQPIYFGTVDRYSIGWDQMQFALVDPSITEAVNLSVPVAEPYFPGAPADSRQQNIPIYIGVLVNAPTIRVSGDPATGTLAFAMDATTTSIMLTEQDAPFPLTGEVTIDAENITYATREQVNQDGQLYLQLGDLTRTSPVTHAAGATVDLVTTAPSYITGFGVRTLNQVRKNGVPLMSGFTASVVMILGQRVPMVTMTGTLDPKTDIITVDVNAPDAPIDLHDPDPPPPPDLSGNQLVNGDFESGDIGGWVVVPGATVSIDDGNSTGIVITGPERIQNGGFETGDLTGWTSQFGGPAIVGTSSPAPHAGTYRLLMSPSYPSQGIVGVYQQVNPVYRGYDTTLSFWYQTDPAAGTTPPDGQLKLTIGTAFPGNPIAYAEVWIPLSSTWTQYALTFQIPYPNALETIATIYLQAWTFLSTSPIGVALDAVSMAQATDEILTQPRGGGFRAAVLGDLNTPQAIFQEFTTLVGRTYDVTIPYRVLTSPFDPTDFSTAHLQLGPPLTPGLYRDLDLPAMPATFAPGGQPYLPSGPVYSVYRTQFTAQTTTTRLTLSSQYTNSALPIYLDDVSVTPAPLVPTDDDAGNPPIPILLEEEGQNPVDVLLYILTSFYPDATYDAAAFNTARGQLTDWKFRGLITNPGMSDAFLQRLGRQCKSLITKDSLNRWTITVLDTTRPLSYRFDMTTIAKESFSRSSVPVDSLYSSFYVYFRTTQGGSTSPGDYEGVTYASPAGTSVPNGQGLVDLCEATQTLYARANRLDFFADLANDFATANLILEWLVQRYAKRKDIVTLRGFLDAVPVRLGQVVRIAHPVLPQHGLPVATEIIGRHFDPSQLEIELVARTLSPLNRIAFTTEDAVVAIDAHTELHITIALTTEAALFNQPTFHAAIAFTTEAALFAPPTVHAAIAFTTEAAIFAPPTVHAAIAFTTEAAVFGIPTIHAAIAFTTENAVVSSEGGGAEPPTAATGLVMSFSFTMEPYAVITMEDGAWDAPNAGTGGSVGGPMITAGAGGTLDLATVDLDPDTPGRQTSITLYDVDDEEWATLTVDDAGALTLDFERFHEANSVVHFTVQDTLAQTSNVGELTIESQPV